jgi:hypothetical protein
MRSHTINPQITDNRTRPLSYSFQILVSVYAARCRIVAFDFERHHLCTLHRLLGGRFEGEFYWHLIHSS